MFRVNVLVVVLVVGVLVGAGDALAATAPAVKVCVKLPNTREQLELGLLGLANNANCSGSVLKGEWAWAWPDPNAALPGEGSIVCVLSVVSPGLWSESLCETLQSGGKFAEALTKRSAPRVLVRILLAILSSAKIAGVEPVIDCKGGLGRGVGKSPTVVVENPVTYTGCTVQKPANCLVNSADQLGGSGIIETTNLVALLQSLKLVLFEPEKGAVFVTLVVGSVPGKTCGIAGELPVKGTESCDWLGTVAEPSVDKLLDCRDSGSLLKLGEVEAKYEAVSHVSVEGGLFWKIQ